jgi:hypothetical protein
MADPIRTTDRLRHEIDQGRSGEKVAFPDPAASPLGTDDEAAGTPAGPADVRLAAAAEIRQPGIDAPAATDERRRGLSGIGRGLGGNADSRPTLLVAAGVLVVGLAVLFMLAG